MANDISKLKLPNGSSSDIRANKLAYGECSTAAATAEKTVTIFSGTDGTGTSQFVLEKGSAVIVRFMNTNGAAAGSLTLNVNGTGAKPIKYRGLELENSEDLAEGRTYQFVYSGTAWELIGDLDTNKELGVDFYKGTLPIDITTTEEELYDWEVYGNNEHEKNYLDWHGRADVDKNNAKMIINADAGTVTISTTDTITADTTTGTIFTVEKSGNYILTADGIPSNIPGTQFDVYPYIIGGSARPKQWDRTTTALSVTGTNSESRIYLEAGVQYSAYVRLKSGGNLGSTVIVVRPMVRYCDQDSEFEPYCEGVGKPTKNIYPVGTTPAGVSAGVTVLTNDLETGTLEASVAAVSTPNYRGINHFSSTNPLRLEDGVSYTISANVESITGDLSDYAMIALRDIRDSGIKHSLHIREVGQQSMTFTWNNSTFPNGAFISFLLTNSASMEGTIKVSNIMIRKTSETSDFIPYGYQLPILSRKPTKNIIDSDIDAVYQNGVTCIADKQAGTYTLNGTATQGFSFRLCNITKISGNYILSGCPDGGSSSKYDLYIYDRTDTTILGRVYDSTQEFEFTANPEHTYQIYIQCRNAQTYSNLVFHPMLRPANTSSEFVPHWETTETDIYVGATPLVLGQSVSKTSTGIEIPTFPEKTRIDTSLFNKPEARLIPTDTAANIIEAIYDLEDTKVDRAGDTITGRTYFQRAINQIITGTGTAGEDKGEGVSPRYFPAKWTFDINTTPVAGDTYIIQTPVAGITYGVYMSINNGTDYYPVVANGTSRITTQYPVGMQLQVIFDPDGSAASIYPVIGGDSSGTVSGGVWRVLNYYDSNTTYSAMSTSELITGTVTTSRVVRSDYLKAGINSLIDTKINALTKPMIFKGTLGTNGTITSLPTAAAANEGYTYKVITAGTYAGQAAEVGDVFISAKPEGASTYSWILIPAGDETFTDTWRNIKVNGTEKLSTSISSGAVDFVNGTNTTVNFNATGNKISINATDTDRYVNSAAFADDTTTNASNPVKMTLTRAGSDTATVTANIPKVSSDSAGVVPKGTTVSTQSQTTKFLREDGSWAAPSYTTNTDAKTSSSNSTSKLFLVGATTQSTSGQTTYSNSGVYTQNGSMYLAPAENATGKMTFISSKLDRDGTVSATTGGNSSVLFTDKDLENVGSIDTYQWTDGKITLGLTTFNETTDGVQKSAHIYMNVAKDGTVSYDVTSPAAFLSAIGGALNTTGATDTSSKIYLVGAPSQTANPVTYSDDEVYVTSGVLTTKSVQIGGGAATLQYNSTTESIDFIFA